MTSGQLDELLGCDLKEIPFTSFTGKKSLYLGTNAVDDLWLLVGGE